MPIVHSKFARFLLWYWIPLLAADILCFWIRVPYHSAGGTGFGDRDGAVALGVELPSASMIADVEVEVEVEVVHAIGLASKGDGPHLCCEGAGSAGRPVEIRRSIKTLDLDSRDVPDVVRR